MHTVTLAVDAMGTRFELVLAGERETHLRAVGENAIREILDWHARLDRFDRSSEVSRINAAQGRAPVRVEPQTFELLRRCIEITTQTAGRFDITVAPAMDAIFGDGDHRRGAIDATRIELDQARRSVRLHAPGMGLDLGAIAKGWALDAAAAILREHGVGRALLHGGTSSLVAIGAPDERSDGWAVALRSPRPEHPGPVVVLRDTALGVSELHGRSADGHGHVIDPSTGRSARGAAAAAVLATSAADADAWSTAALAANARPEGFAAEWGFFLLPEAGPWIVEGVRQDASGRYTLRPKEA